MIQIRFRLNFPFIHNLSSIEGPKVSVSDVASFSEWAPNWASVLRYSISVIPVTRLKTRRIRSTLENPQVMASL